MIHTFFFRKSIVQRVCAKKLFTYFTHLFPFIQFPIQYYFIRKMNPLLNSDSDESEEEKIPRVYRTQNTLDNFTDINVIRHFRLPRGTIIQLAEMIQGKIERQYESRSTDLDPIFQVQIALFFYATGDHQKTIAQACGISQSSVSKIVTSVTNALLDLAPQFVKYPEAGELNEIKAGFYAKSQMPRIIGIIDGSFIPLQRPPNQLDYHFVCRKGYTALNTLGVCDHRKKFIAFLCNHPGSCHDSYVLRSSNFFQKMETAPLDGIILGDSAYPAKAWLFPPVRNPQTDAQERYNLAHSHTRYIIEQCFGIWKNRFRCLMNKCRLKPEKLCKIATVCAFLHNVAIDANAPLPLDDNEDEQENEVENDDAPNQQQIPANVAAIMNDYIIHNF